MKNIVYRGRYILQQEKPHFFNVASGISLLFKGKKITFDISFKVKSGFIYIIKDFDYSKKEKFFIKDSEKVTIEFSDNKEHFIDVLKANEAIDNVMVVNDISYDGEILKYRNKQDKFIKVYGDSTIAGYGILKHEGTPDIDTNDGVENFCFRAIYSLDYDYDIFAASGWGLTFSAYTDPKETGIEKYKDDVSVFCHEKWPDRHADLLIISLGTNDHSYIQENIVKKSELETKFIHSYKEFIKKEREKNGNVPILMIYGTLKEENVYSLIEKTYQEISKRFKDVYLVKMPGDNSGLSSHSFVFYHQKMSEILKEKIIQILS